MADQLQRPDMEVEFIDLNTEAGIARLCAMLAQQLGRAVRGPFMTTPPARRQMFAEGLLSGVTGLIVGMVGYEGAKVAMDIARRAAEADAPNIKPSESQGKPPNGAEVSTLQNATAREHPLTPEEEARLRDLES